MPPILAKLLEKHHQHRASLPKRARPVSEFLTSEENVKVYVGPKRKLWVLNEALLCDRSEYFRAAFEGGFKEAEEKQIHLDDEDTSAFGMVVDWIYGNKVLCNLEHHDEDTSTGDDLIDGRDDAISIPKDVAHFSTLCKLYILADKYGLDELKDASIQQYQRCSEQHGWVPERDEVIHVYQNTLPNSPFRSLMTAIVVQSFLRGSRLEHWVSLLSCEPVFGLDVAQMLRAHLFPH